MEKKLCFSIDKMLNFSKINKFSSLEKFNSVSIVQPQLLLSLSSASARSAGDCTLFLNKL